MVKVTVGEGGELKGTEADVVKCLLLMCCVMCVGRSGMCVLVSIQKRDEEMIMLLERSDECRAARSAVHYLE